MVGDAPSESAILTLREASAITKLSLSTLSLGMHKMGLGMDSTVPPEAAYLQSGLGERMPLPSMMLGYIGENGTDIETVIATITRGTQSDYRGQRKGI